ncbi:MAG: ribonuclease J [Hyphomicrobiaceae bacterium]|nr:ribonuclease J [Hyphomicrobiaceae bacterium]MCC0023497.1 ribonuclease J [Hyphomicrobiaceae bacterium]
MSDELVFVPLGGVGEIGMNMAAYGFGPEEDRKWLIVDCGVSFAGPNEPGIDLIMADTAFVEENLESVVGLVLTHAHEDHYGAVIDLWAGFELPVYATAFTVGMLRAKLATDGQGVHVDIRTVDQGVKFEVGPFHLEFVSMAHSIPESSALLIDTPAGRVFHTGDWKLEENPSLGAGTNVARIKQIGDEGHPLALVCDSTNALKDGKSPSEAEAEKGLRELIGSAAQRVAVTLFSSNLGRVAAVARAAHAAGREVVLSGRSLHRVVNVGRELGMLEGLPNFHDQEALQFLPRDKVVLICTGSQGEPRAAIARIAEDTHPVLHLDAGDRVIFSSWAIPGNERAVTDIQNRFIDRGVDVFTNNDALIHVSGHPRRDELRALYEWLRPETLVPVHGEAAHLQAHAELGRSAGIEHVLPIRNGDMAMLFPRPEISADEVPVGRLYLDGALLCTRDESGIKGRRRLQFGGAVVLSLCVGSDGRFVGKPAVLIEGLPEVEDEEGGAEDVVFATIESVAKSMPTKKRRDAAVLQEALRRAVRSDLNEWWGKKPNVSVIVHRV